MNLFHRDEINRKSDKYPRRDSKPEEEVHNHHWQAINCKESHDPAPSRAAAKTQPHPPRPLTPVFFFSSVSGAISHAGRTSEECNLSANPNSQQSSPAPKPNMPANCKKHSPLFSPRYR